LAQLGHHFAPGLKEDMAGVSLVITTSLQLLHHTPGAHVSVCVCGGACTLTVAAGLGDAVADICGDTTCVQPTSSRIKGNKNFIFIFSQIKKAA
jgi:hypothetical protein